MPTKYRRRGFAHERDLVLKLWEKGFAVMRAPASGSKTTRVAYPDIVAIKNNVVFVFEVKTTRSQDNIYVRKIQVEKLLWFLNRAGKGYAFIAVKYIGQTGWRFINIGDLEKTRSENYKVTRETLKNSLRLADIVSLATNNTRIDDYMLENDR